MEPLLLLHGALGAESQFKPLLPLLPANLPVYSFNLSGLGGLPLPEGPFRIAHFVEQLLTWLDEQPFKKVRVFGYSMGGYVALEAARQKPERFSGIFTLATKFSWSPEIAAHEVSRLNPEIISLKVPVFAQALQQRHAPQDWQEVMRRTAQMMLELGENPILTPEKLAKIAVPVTIAVGDQDQMVTVAESRNAAKTIPGAGFEILPNTRHPLEQLDWPRLATSLQDFFKYA